MYINELEAGTTVTINAADGVGSIRLESEVIALNQSDYDYVDRAAVKAGLGQFVAVHTVMDGNHPINFLSAKVQCIITALQDNKPYSWKRVKILRVNLPNAGDCHLIFSTDNAKIFNRRSEYRLFLGYDAQCRVGESQVPREIVLKDVSESGAGFLISDEHEVETGMPVKIQFFEMVNGKPILYTINAVVIRYVSMSDHRLFVGCRITENNEALKNLIYSKQRQSLSGAGNGGKAKEDLDKRANDAAVAKELYQEISKEK